MNKPELKKQTRIAAKRAGINLVKTINAAAIVIVVFIAAIVVGVL